MQCRTNALSTGAQVTCLEKALRKVLPAVPKPDWAGTSSLGRSNTNNVAGISSYKIAPAFPSGIGSEQVALKGEALEQQRQEYFSAEQSRVIDFAFTQSKQLILILNNGQVWKQRKGDLNTVNLKSGDEPIVSIKRGAVSGYRMHFPQYSRTIGVSRIQ